MDKKENDKIKSGKPLRILESDDYIVRSECAISILKSKLQIINSELSLISGRKVITTISGRTKTIDSTRIKLIKRKLALNFETAVEKINDLNPNIQWLEMDLAHKECMENHCA